MALAIGDYIVAVSLSWQTGLNYLTIVVFGTGVFSMKMALLVDYRGVILADD